MTVSGAKIWLSIEEMVYIVHHEHKPNLIAKNIIRDLKEKLRQELKSIDRYNEVENQ
jgi:hypothetical protein